MNGTTAYVLSKQYVADTADSLGSLKGAPCTIKSITEVDGGQKVTFEWTGTSGTKQTSEMTVKNGVSITNISIDANNNLVCTMSDGTEYKSKIDLLDNVYTKTETDTLLLDKAEKNHNHDSAYASKDTEHEHTNKETLDKFGVNDGGKLTFNGDVVTPEASDLSDYLKKTDAQDTYVEKETGKGLSENDFTTVLKDAYDKAVEDSHTHTNKSVIDKFSESADGKLLYDGQSIEADLSTVYKKTETYSQTESDDKFVEKEDGKGLSSNDYTTEEKNKLAGLENYNDTALSNRVKSIEDEVPNLATKTYVGEQISNADHLKREIVTEIPKPETADKNTIYMLKIESVTGNDKYREYLLIDGTVQCVGDTSVDLTDYAKTTDVDKKLNNKADKNEIPTTVAELTDSADYAKKTDIPTTLPADGGNADTVNNHTVESDVPVDAVFTDTTYSDATQMEHGLMSVDDKKKLDGLKKYTPDGTTITADEDGTLHGVAEVTVDDAMSDTSTNPVQNKVVKKYVDDKASENVDFSTSTSKLLNGTVEAPLVLSNATRNLLSGTFANQTYEGITYTSNGDGTYSVKGSRTGNSSSYTNSILVNVQKGKTYKVLGSKSTNISVVSVYKKDNETPVAASKGNDTFIADEDQVNLCLYVPADAEGFIDEILKPMLTTDLSATYDDFVPYGGYEIKTCGKNLLDLKNKGKDTYTNAGITYTKQSDGSYKRTGTAASDTGNIWLFGSYQIVPNGTNHLLTLKKDHTYFVFDCVLFSMVNGMVWAANNPSATPGVHTITPSQDTYITGIRDYGISKDNTYNDIVYPRVFEADHDLGWSPYAESTIHIDSTTEFPLLGLKSFDGITNIISPCNVEVTYAKSDSGAAILDTSEKYVKDARKETTVNLLKPTLETHTEYGITCTANGDGTYTLNGTPSIPGEHFGWRLVQNFQKNIYGGYLFTGAPLTADGYRLYVGYFDDNDTWKAEKFVGSEGIVIDGSYPRISFEIVFDKGASPANNLLFKPMLTTNLNATYDDFVPYTGDSGSLNWDVAELKDGKADKSETTVNLLNPTLQTSTSKGITCTNNGDSTFTFNGTSTVEPNEECRFDIQQINDIVKKNVNNDLWLVGCPKNGKMNRYRLQFWNKESGLILDTGDGCKVHITENMMQSYSGIAVVFEAGATVNNLVFKPMLTTNFNATYDDFVPYTGDGDTLASDVAEIKNDLGGLSFSASGTTLTITDGTNTWTLGANS